LGRENGGNGRCKTHSPFLLNKDCLAAIAHGRLWHIAAQSQSGHMSAAGESRLGRALIVADDHERAGHRQTGLVLGRGIALVWGVVVR
jgi:hypothetical protein